jgi:hypothetical protein
MHTYKQTYFMLGTDLWRTGVNNHCCSASTAVGTVMLNRKEMPKQAFSAKLEKGEKISCQRDHLLAIKWDTCHVLFVTNVHEDEFVEAPLSRGAHNKIKPTTVLDYSKYKAGVDRSDQMLSYYLFARKMVKWWKKVFFHLFDLAIVSSHILHTETNQNEIPLEMFCEKIAEGLITSAGTEIQVHGKTSTPAGRLIGRDHFLYRIPVTHAKLEGKL